MVINYKTKPIHESNGKRCFANHVYFNHVHIHIYTVSLVIDEIIAADISSFIYIYSKLHAKSAIYKICFEFYKMSLLNSNLLFKRVGFVVLMMYSAIGHLSMEFKRNFSYKHINMKFVFSLPSNWIQDANNYKVYSVECTTCPWLIRRRWGQATQLLVIFK